MQLVKNSALQRFKRLICSNPPVHRTTQVHGSPPRLTIKYESQSEFASHSNHRVPHAPKQTCTTPIIWLHAHHMDSRHYQQPLALTNSSRILPDRGSDVTQYYHPPAALVLCHQLKSNNLFIPALTPLCCVAALQLFDVYNT